MCPPDTRVRCRRFNARRARRQACTNDRAPNSLTGLSLRSARISLLIAATLGVAHAQVPDIWKHVAGTSINAGLAGPASGPVVAVWYGSSARRLFVETSSSRIFETADFAHWRLNTDVVPPQVAPAANVGRLPEAGARVRSAGTRLYEATPSNIYASDDSGRTWINLTGFNNRSIIGDGFTSLAIAPDNPQEIAAANRFGVWRSLDGGLSWHSLNEDLPNLSVRRMLDSRTVALADGAVETVQSGIWTAAESSDTEAALRTRFSAAAVAAAGTTVYAGKADGRILVSRDNGSGWGEAARVAAEGISRIWVDADRPDSALAAAGAHLYRTVNGGLFWDEVTGALPPSTIHGIAADRSAGIVYVATDRGVFSSRISLNDASPATAPWTAMTRDLPAAPAWDVRLNPDNTLSVALDGYGVFETAAPHRTQNVRIVSGADLADRPAAPGSLISVLGAKVASVSNRGLAYPVLASSDRSSQLQVPFEATAGTYSLALKGANDTWTVPLTVHDTAPAIFVDADGAPLLVDAASGLVLDPKLAVEAGSTIGLLATGLGKVIPDWPTGVPAPADQPPVVAGTVSAFLDGRPVEVTRAVLAPSYVGYYMVELQIPTIVNRGVSELRIVMNGAESNRVRLSLESNISAQ
jgi:uncharacterized protein (TIGR03437 family)